MRGISARLDGFQYRRVRHDCCSPDLICAEATFKAVGATNYSALQSAFNQARNSSSNNQNFLEQSCGVRINNTDAGTSTAKTAAQYNSFTKNGLKVNVTYHTVSDTDAGEAFGCSGATYLAKQRLVTRALYNRWISAAIWGLPRV